MGVESSESGALTGQHQIWSRRGSVRMDRRWAKGMIKAVNGRNLRICGRLNESLWGGCVDSRDVVVAAAVAPALR